MEGAKTEISTFKIADRIGSSMGSYENNGSNLLGIGINYRNMLSGVRRELISIAGIAYFNAKYFK